MKKVNYIATVAGFVMGVILGFIITRNTIGFETTADAVFFFIIIIIVFVGLYYLFLKRIENIVNKQRTVIVMECQSKGVEVDQLYEMRKNEESNRS